MARLVRVQPGDPITAEAYNALIDLAAELGISVAEGGDLAILGGVVASNRPWEGWVKLTGGGTGGKYDWTQVHRVSGSWTAGILAGTTADDPANEANAYAGLTTFPTIVRAWRTDAGLLMFQSDAC